MRQTKVIATCLQYAGIAFLLSACGGDASSDTETQASTDTQSVAAGPENACAALTAADVESVLGEPVRDSLALDMPGSGAPTTMSQCNYATANNAAAISLLLRRSAAGESPDAASQSVRQTMTESNVPVEDVAGLGDVAFWAGNQLHVFVANGWYLIVSPVPAAGLPQARSLAQLAMARL